MTKRNKKNEKLDKLSFFLIRLLIMLAIIVSIIFIGDMFNLSDNLNIHLRFDWAMIVCTFMSAVATISLGVVSKKQNDRLSELNEKSLKTAKINNGYSLIHFREKQFIEGCGNLLKVKLYDTKSIPLKHIKINQVRLQPLLYVYVEEDSPKIILTDEKQKIDLKFTPVNPDNKEEFYFADIEVKFPFDKYNKGKYLRLEFDMEITNVLGVTTKYDYYVLNEVFSKDENRIVLKNYYEYNYCREIGISSTS